MHQLQFFLKKKNTKEKKYNSTQDKKLLDLELSIKESARNTATITIIYFSIQFITELWLMYYTNTKNNFRIWHSDSFCYKSVQYIFVGIEMWRYRTVGFFFIANLVCCLLKTMERVSNVPRGRSPKPKSLIFLNFSAFLIQIIK